MKKNLKITLIILGVLIGIITLDTLQAKIFNNSPILKIRKDFNDGRTSYIDKGIFVNHYYCINEKEETLFKGVKYTCPKSINENDSLLDGNTPLTNKTNLIFSIKVGQKDCIPVNLAVYEDKTYELFTSYQSCKPGEFCNDMLIYTKSTKGKYDYNVLKILEDSSIEKDTSHSMDNLPEYEIYMSDKYVQKGYGYCYTVEQGKTNKLLDDFLKHININLNICAEPDYIN